MIVGVPPGGRATAGAFSCCYRSVEAIYSAGALQLITRRAVWSENYPHNLAPSVGILEKYMASDGQRENIGGDTPARSGRPIDLDVEGDNHSTENHDQGHGERDVGQEGGTSK